MSTGTKFTFNGEEYDMETVTDKAKYILKQISDLRQQHEDLKAKLDQVIVAEQAFSNLLGDELIEPESTKT